jgi:hypothetical protein
MLLVGDCPKFGPAKSWSDAAPLYGMDAMKTIYFRRKMNWILSVDTFTAFVIFLLALSLEATAANQGADRTITWQPWQEWPELRVRTGDRYLGDGQWEHYLGFEQRRGSAKAIKISKIYLATEAVPDVVIAPERRYAIVKVSNSTMTARKGRWSWAMQEDTTGGGPPTKTTQRTATGTPSRSPTPALIVDLSKYTQEDLAFYAGYCDAQLEAALSRGDTAAALAWAKARTAALDAVARYPKPKPYGEHTRFRPRRRAAPAPTAEQRPHPTPTPEEPMRRPGYLLPPNWPAE